MKVSNVDMTDVADIIAFEGTPWEGPIIKRTSLNSDGHYWYEFVRHWLLPTMNPSEVTRARGVLVYAIMTRARIDVITLIQNSLLAKIRSLGSEFVKDQNVKKSPLLYPTLIHLLCERAGVPRYARDMERESGGMIVWTEKTPGEPLQRARTTSTRGESSSARPVTLASLQQSVEQMRIDQLEVRARIMQQEQEMGPYLGRYMREMMLYSDRVCGLAAIDYPYPPAFPTYTPSREDAETAERDDAPDEAAEMDDDEE